MKHLISISDLNKKQIMAILQATQRMKAAEYLVDIPNFIMASCFFEPSTRTRLSFEAATLGLRGQVIHFPEEDLSSMKKGESLSDTLKIMEAYADILVIRHSKEGAARLASQICSIPVINAGDGSHQHPTQTLLDLYTIYELFTRLDNLPIAMVGDLKYSRTIHSLLLACCLFKIRLYLVSPNHLSLPSYFFNILKTHRLKFSCHDSISEVLPHVEVVYMTRLHKERMQANELHSMKSCYLSRELLTKARPSMKILHPLPRQEELPPTIDDLPCAAYFEQAKNGLHLRKTLLSMFLSNKQNKSHKKIYPVGI